MNLLSTTFRMVEKWSDPLTSVLPAGYSGGMMNMPPWPAEPPGVLRYWIAFKVENDNEREYLLGKLDELMEVETNG